MLLRHARASARSIALGGALVLALCLGVGSAASASPFSDTDGSTAEAVEALVGAGVVQGCGGGEFCTWQPLTRGQMATVLVTALELPSVDLAAADGADRFADIGGSVHAGNIVALADAGIVRGCSGDDYCPQDAVTRGQMATMLSGAFALDATDGVFFDDGGTTHGGSVNRVGAAGISAGCGDPLTAFCTGRPLMRGQSALFIARAMDLIDRVELSPLAERREQQAAIDAEAAAAAAARAEAQAAERAAATAAAAARAEADAAAARLKIWDDLARCESGGNWAINTGNGYYGGLQFSLSSWRWVGGSGYPHQATKTEQIRRGEMLLSRQGWGAWPACSRRLGYR